MLREAVIAAHVPVACCAGRAGHGIRAAHDGHYRFARLEPRAALAHARQAFVAKDETLTTRRWRAVLAGQDLEVRAADAYRERFERQARRIAAGRVEVIEARGVWGTRQHGQGLHSKWTGAAARRSRTSPRRFGRLEN